MGSAKMAEMANISVETAEHVQAGIWERSPVLKQFIERKCQWAIDHPGYIESALGDVVELDENDGADRAARLELVSTL